MRDLLNDMSEGLSHPDPIRRAQIQMKKPLPKRFYKTVSQSPARNEGFAIELDGKACPHAGPQAPGRLDDSSLRNCSLPRWNAQADLIDPATMPVTRLVNTAIDGVAHGHAGRLRRHTAVLHAAISSAIGPTSRKRWSSGRQKLWDPVLDWCGNDLGARFILIEGVMHHDQPREAIAAFSAALRRHDNATGARCPAYDHDADRLRVAGTCLCRRRSADEDEVWSLAHLDEDWTIEHWGSDEEAEQRRAQRFEEFKAAVNVFWR